MEKGANIASFSEEFGKWSGNKAMEGRGSDNSEEAANKARHSNFDFGVKAKNDEIKYPDGPGARWTDKAYTSPNEAGK